MSKALETVNKTVKDALPQMMKDVWTEKENDGTDDAFDRGDLSGKSEKKEVQELECCI